MTVTAVHVLRYDAAGHSWSDLKAARPPGATYWHPGVLAPRDSNGIPVPDEREWTVLATWPDEAACREALDGPGPWTGTREAWSVLLRAGGTRFVPAAARWADGTETVPFGTPAAELPSGPVAVLTTVGLSADLGEALRFARDVQEVVGTLPAAPGYLGHRLGGAEDFPQRVDAFTFTLWERDADARAWAYRTGVHAAAIREHMSGAHVVRGSFTMFGVLATQGHWSGLRAPVLAAAR